MMIPDSYELIQNDRIEEIGSDVCLLRHKRSGARVLAVSNSEENKVFAIGFRTPVSDSTGVPHIMEHSVLCGSERFPVKDPFMSMCKGSLHTFLNAFTYPDKTVYPVASCNDKDFANLMSVYMDAVLRPNIYASEHVFRQEGWHYELETPESELSLNGIVYNEMKGAFSSPEDVMERYILNSLFPDTGYGFESGGDPEVIPTLTYEQFLDFHRRYYHPSNSYIYLYGNMDMEERLNWMDREYLSKYDAIRVDSGIKAQPAFQEPVFLQMPYSIGEDEETEDKTWISRQWAVGSILDPKLYLAGQILDYALVSAEGAPLKQALLDAELGEDVFGGFRTDCLQPYFTLTLKNTSPDKQTAFVQVIDDMLRELVTDGIGTKALMAAINCIEFRLREADYGSAPRGLVYGLGCLESWLYDDDAPCTHLHFNDTFRFMKENVENGYFEGLLKSWFIDNRHESLVVLTPEKGLSAEKEAALKEQLAAKKAALSEDEVEVLIRETKDLKEFGAAEDLPEDLAKLPSLELSDVSAEVLPVSTVEKTIDGIRYLEHETFTAGITYLTLMYDLRGIPNGELYTLGMLQMVYSMVATEHYTFAELSHEINLVTGGYGCKVTALEEYDGSGRFEPCFCVNLKFMHDRLEDAYRLLDEIHRSSDYTDEKRLKDMVLQLRSRLEMQLMGASHSAAIARAMSYTNISNKFMEMTGGMDFYRYVCDLAEHFDEKKQELTDSLTALAKKVFDAAVLVDITDDGSFMEKVEACSGKWLKAAPLAPEEDRSCLLDGSRNEGFKTPGQVNYAAVAGNFKTVGLPYHGSLRVLQNLMSSEYLWVNIRVQGGAYGCMCNFTRNGKGYFVSYRDPHLKETYEVYRKAVDYLRTLELEPEALKNYIIGSIGSKDRPRSPSDWGALSFRCYYHGITEEERKTERLQILNCSVEDLRKCADYVEAILNQNRICTIGTANAIEANQEMFDQVRNLI